MLTQVVKEGKNEYWRENDRQENVKYIRVCVCVYKDKAGQKNEKYIFLKQRAFVDLKMFAFNPLKIFFIKK